ncbi:MAG: DUF4922 domain-containing protein [Prevotella sp.]|nr:DUF4922 domain-containing protein [Prevotella sp.]
MRGKIDCYLPCDDLAVAEMTVSQLRTDRTIRHIFLLVRETITDECPDGCTMLTIGHLLSTDSIRTIAEAATTDYVLLFTQPTPVLMGQYATERLLHVAADSGAAMVYADHYSVENGKTVRHPVIDYQEGSIRDDFDFGSLMLIRADILREYVSQERLPQYAFAGLYDLRLYISRHGSILHLGEYLYTEQELDLRASGEKQFDYVNPRNREVQVEMEQAATQHLREVGALVDTSTYIIPDFAEQTFEYEASVVIPVFNRERTICDAVDSALSQKTSFRYNVIVVDNHSTDGTTRLLEQYDDPRLVHIIPSRTDLGIGGCWNTAVVDDRCGRFAVQLDSDDLYSSPNTLQQIVDAFYQQKAAMVIGSYRMCDFDLNTLPPGLIDHREWTAENGCNNALRINGLGAPRAFFTPLLRQVLFPNTSYGEDYALGLAFSRRYRIGRIYSELYLCRRWGGNSDAALSIERVNDNNRYKDQLRTLEIAARRQMAVGEGGWKDSDSLDRFFNRQLERWPDARQRYRDLQDVQTRELVAETNSMAITLQWNPARMVSTGAKMDKRTLAERPCFLCEKNRPAEQIVKAFDNRLDILVNPFPILPTHFTIVGRKHLPQQIKDIYYEMYRLLERSPKLTIFYNGPRCGASAPDHQHLQAFSSGLLPLQTNWQRLSRNLRPLVEHNKNEGIFVVSDYPCHALLIRSRSKENGEQLFRRLYDVIDKNVTESEREEGEEPMLNIVTWRQDDDFLSVVFPRRRHRPACYHAEGAARRMVSPGALDMAGLIITPRQEDFEQLDAETAIAILREVAVSDADMHRLTEAFEEKQKQPSIPLMDNEPMVAVGIVSGSKISFTLNKTYIAKGETVEGEQLVEFCEGGILWRGHQYRELSFSPKSADASFSLHEVTIGVNFHWERKETQTFLGSLRLVVEADKICAINFLPVEDYLTSVISSEMKATASLELLKAHAVISRSWLLAQIERRKQISQTGDSFFSFTKKDDEMIRWYDREDHTIFDVCADDHCQRYQGITKASDPKVAKAIAATRGQVLSSDSEICDARFSKCCGGVTEEFQYCWENVAKPYLRAVGDNPSGQLPDLRVEQNARRWILADEEAYCNTRDKKVLAQVLNDFDTETADFYRWRVEYTQERLARLISEKLKTDFGGIKALTPVERGRSGRISRLRIEGTLRTLVIGKELEIRRALSESHLLSSAFIVDTEGEADGLPAKFILRGAGWGHGVGLCQIGAAVMGEQGKTYDEILLHYYRGAEITKLYK